VFRICLVIALLGWLVAHARSRWQAWRLPLAFVVVAGIVGPGIVVNWVFKENWQRARPYQVENFGGAQKFSRATVPTDQCDNNCSFVSGHVACGVFLVSIGLVHRRRQRRWAVAGVVSGLVIGFARMADVAHWLSDVLWAVPITLLSSWLVWKALVLLYRKPSSTVG
jgi:lipid A 4'-phosphatase